MLGTESSSGSLTTVLPLAVSDGLVIQETGDETLVFNLLTNKAICLNQTAALVWQSCDGSRGLPEIAQRMEKKLGSPVNEDLVWIALDQLRKEGLVSGGEYSPDKFDGLSRREVIKKIGFGSLVALPIVSAIVAPNAAMAQSCLAPGPILIPSTCTDNVSFCINNQGLCCSGTASLGIPCTQPNTPPGFFHCVCAP